MTEHKRALGRRPSPEILETGRSIEWRTAEYRWIEFFRAQGVRLTNRTAGGNGAETLSVEARAKLSAATRGRQVGIETRAKIRKAQKGVPRGWTPEGEQRVRANQFKRGHRRWEELSPEAKALHALASRALWHDVPKEERSQRAKERAIKQWLGRDIEARSELGQKISTARLKNTTPGQRQKAAKLAAQTMLEKHPDIADRNSASMKAWWGSMSPEYRAEYLKRRTAAMIAAKAAKRAATDQ